MTTSIDQSCCEQLEQRDLAHNVHTGWVRVRQAASAGVKGDLMDWTHWGWEYMRQLQETENRQTPGATTWEVDFLIREGESREFLDLWFASERE
jgi:hypothetical protein